MPTHSSQTHPGLSLSFVHKSCRATVALSPPPPTHTTPDHHWVGGFN